jgi:nucleotide-binding universal stress UspA family protein
MGSRGPWPLAGLFHASVAHQVIQGATCPVLVSPIEDGAAGDVPLLGRVVLVADGSAPAERAATLLRHLLPGGSEVVVVHVHESPVAALIASASFGSVGAGHWGPETELEARQVTEEPAAKLAAAGIRVRRHLVEGVHGTIADQVVATARESRAGMIAMGSRGLADLRGILLGSVTHSVLCHARRPLLVVP